MKLSKQEVIKNLVTDALSLVLEDVEKRTGKDFAPYWCADFKIRLVHELVESGISIIEPFPEWPDWIRQWHGVATEYLKTLDGDND